MDDVSNFKTYRIKITGRVQGVGFRPYVYRLALKCGLAGYVRNGAAGVEIEVSGAQARLERFIAELRADKPPRAMIDNFFSEVISSKKYEKFSIIGSEDASAPIHSIIISSDIAVCADCAKEITDVNDRRYAYAFTNCTNCGPRYTITANLPYDRPLTSMSSFKMCERCQGEYDDPVNRRFHAQPNACCECGPGLALINKAEGSFNVSDIKYSGDTYDVIKKCAKKIKDGEIGAIMGLGGFHIAALAGSDEIALRLRKLKRRPFKAFALMAPSISDIKKICEVSPEEESLLGSYIAPIVLLRKKETPGLAETISKLVAPDNDYLGFMLAYTPLHMILMNEIGAPIIMTSANLSQEPIFYKLSDIKAGLFSLCDFAMVHNREILVACDDSVMFVECGREIVVRAARGIAPNAIQVKNSGCAKKIISVGAVMKNTVSVGLKDNILTSQHIGDTGNSGNYDLMSDIVKRFSSLYNFAPDFYAHDMHPGSNSASYCIGEAGRCGAKTVSLQHHYAHILSVMAECGLYKPVIGLAFDGTGFGGDGNVWGGEFLVCDTEKYIRSGYFESFGVQNYDGAVKDVSKLALMAIYEFFKDDFEKYDIIKNISSLEKNVILKAIDGGLNVVRSSSLGRIFDVVSAVAGFSRPTSFEAEAAVWLESKIGRDKKDEAAEIYDGDLYPYSVAFRGGAFVIEWKGILGGAVSDKKRGATEGEISLKFHKSVISAIYETTVKISAKSGVKDICLSGGVFYNRVLFSALMKLLHKNSYNVYLAAKSGFGDNSVSVGQCYYAMLNFGGSRFKF